MPAPVLPYQQSPPSPERSGYSRVGVASLAVFFAASSSIAITREQTGCFNLCLFLIGGLVAAAGIAQRTRTRRLAFLALLLNAGGAAGVFVWLLHLAERYPFQV
jgi:hypothetical protein